MLKRYRLADPAHTVPMPDRGGRLFSQEARGENVDSEHPFYLAMIAYGDIVEAAPDAATEAAVTEQPADDLRGKSKGK